MWNILTLSAVTILYIMFLVQYLFVIPFTYTLIFTAMFFGIWWLSNNRVVNYIFGMVVFYGIIYLALKSYQNRY